MSRQRRRGQDIVVYKTKVVTDNRGNTVKVVDTEVGPYVRRAAVIPQRSSKAEVPGQQVIEVVRLLIDSDMTDVTLWTRVEYRGATWDIAAPPAFHDGPRGVRHYSVDIRKRPN